MWVLDFSKEKVHNTSAGGGESTFNKSGDSDTKEGLRVGEQ